MLLNVITQLPDGELEKVTAPLTSPLAHHLCIIGEFQEVSGIVDNFPQNIKNTSLELDGGRALTTSILTSSCSCCLG